MTAATLATLALIGTACSGRPGAAEPAVAPTLGVAPAGTTRAVGAAPEGIVYDPRTDLVAVAVRDPDRLRLLDPVSLRVRRTVPLPGDVRHLQLAAPGGPVLVPVESVDRLVEVALPGGATRSVAVGDQPHDATEAGGDIVVGNEFGHSLSVIRSGRVIATLPGVRQPGGVIADGDSVAVVDVHGFDVATYDLARRTRTATIPAGDGPTHGALVAGDRLVVTDTRGDAVLVVGLNPLRRLSRLALPGTPYGIASDPSTGLVWVTLTARNQVVGLDVSGARPKVVARYPTVRQPNTVAVAPGSHQLWITGTDAGVVERITR